MRVTNKILLIFKICIFITFFPNAQAQILPSDTRLKAAYCLGINLERINEAKIILTNENSTTSEYSKMLYEGISETNESIRRLRTYILPLMLDDAQGSASLQLGTAIKYGELDFTSLIHRSQAFAHKEHSSTIKQCIDTKFGQLNPNDFDGDTYTVIYYECKVITLDEFKETERLWTKIKPCYKVDWLPF
jgi:hypothetical protein